MRDSFHHENKPPCLSVCLEHTATTGTPSNTTGLLIPNSGDWKTVGFKFNHPANR